MTHHSETFHQGGNAFETHTDGKIICFDDSEDNKVASPKRALLGALAACSGIDVVSILEKMRVSFSNFSIKVDGDLTEDYPKYYDHIRMVFKIRVAEHDREKMEKAVNLSIEKYCGVYAMLSKAAIVESSIEWL